MDFQYCVVYCTCPDQGSAERISQSLLENRLAACINIVSQIESHFVWLGQKTVEQEVLLIIKTHKSKLPNMEKTIVQLHPYDCPEVIALPIIFGHKPYLDWVAESTD